MRALLLTLATLGLQACVSGQDPAVEPPEATETQQDPGKLRVEAFEAERSGRHAEAADAFMKLSELQPTNADWVVRAADNMGKSGRFNDAMDLLESAGRKFPDELKIPAQLARVFHLKADTMVADGIRDSNVQFYYQDTIRTGEAVLKADPRHLDARLLVASARYQLGNYDAALEHAEKAVEFYPKEYGGQAMVGRIAFQRFVDAQQRLSQEKPTGAVKAAMIEVTNKWRMRATKAFEGAAAADGTRAFPQIKLGDIAAWSGRQKVARDHYARAMAIDPKSNVNHGWLRTAATGEERKAMYKAALDAYSARAGAKPDGAATITWYLAQAHFDNREWQAAATLWEASLAGLPTYADTHYWLFQSHYWGGDQQKAGKSAVLMSRTAPQRFADLIRNDETSVAVIVGLAAQAYNSGKLPDSRDLNQVIAYAKQTADAWNNYAFLCRDTRRYDDALRGYETALGLEPDSPQLLNDTAVMLQYHFRSDENLARALSMYEQAVKLATERLSAGNLSADERKLTETALRDARGNLRKLGRRRR